ncbi:hypothetical protein KGY77_11465, partial [Candidatus Bipolaricaulota bacterium]|nr:hypothetical protein [Candidatus Bipolaricaulota bacterium]
PTKELSSGQYEVVSRDRDYLVLLQDRTSLVRSWVKDYISEFNKDLPEEEKKNYPFNPGTDYEEEFLRGLEEYINLTVGKENLRLSEYRQERFYYLGVTGVKRENFQLEVKLDEDWQSVEDLPSYSYTLFPEKGMLDLDFPSEFFENLKDKGIKVSFLYEISGKVYMLGFSVAPGSEKVYLNGELLERNTDYSIDYETGALLIFKELGPDDKIRVDFERARGGFGGFAEYGRNLYGFSTRMESDYGLVMDVSLFQARDSAPEEIPAEASTMPNVHTVAGVEAKYQENGWDVGLKFAGNVNRFPFDDNKRTHLPNKINEIISLSDQGYDMTLFLHNNGFTARESDGWESYGPGDGLAGNRVNAGVAVGSFLYLGTDTGLTVVNLRGVAPFGRSANWNSYYEEDGLPEGKILSLASNGETLWAGTSSGVMQAEIGSLDEDDPWIETTSDYFDDIPVSSVVSVDDRLWLGTEEGLYLFDLTREESIEKSPYVKEKILDLKTKDGDLFAATEEGIVRIGGDLSQERLVEGESVYGLSVETGEVWFGTDRGFSKVGSAVRYGKNMITAVELTDSAVWAGSKGDASENPAELVLYKLTDSLTRYLTDETKIEGLDENRYRNIDPDLHTDRGVFFSGKVGKEFVVQSRSVTLATDFKYVQPTYTPIGKTDRNDQLSTGVSLDVELAKNLSVGLGSDYSISSLSTGSGAWSISNRISAYWETLVNLTGEFTWEIGEKSKDRLGLSLGVDKALWEDTLTLATNFSAHREIVSDNITNDYATLSTKMSFSPLSSVTAGFNYTYPLSIGPFERREEDKLTWNFDFSREISLSPDYGAGFQLNGEGNMYSPLLEGVESFDSKARVQLEPDKLGIIGFDLSPVFSLSWKTDGSSHELV